MSRKPKIYEVATPRGTEYRVMGYVRGERKYLGQYKSRAKAERMAKTLTRHVGRKGKTLEDFGEVWIEGRNDYKTDLGRWRNHIASSFIAGMELRRIKPKDVRRWLSEVTDKDISAKTADRCRSLLSACMRDAILEGVIDYNPVSPVPVPKDRKRDIWTWLSLEEIARVESWPAFQRWKRKRFAHSLFTTAIYAGLRKGELYGLRWEHVDLGERAAVEIVATNTGAPKNGFSYRTVPLLPPAKQALKAWRDHGGVRKEWGLVWPGDSGSPRKRDDMAGWTHCRKSLGLWRPHPYPKDSRTKDGLLWPTIHDLRHTCASQLIQGGWGEPWTLEEIRRFLGHASTTQTERYAHLHPDYLHGVSDAKVRLVNKNLLTETIEVKPR